MRLVYLSLIIAIGVAQSTRMPAQTHSGFPIDVVVGPPPQPVSSNGHQWLVYELHVTNFAPLPVTLNAIEVLGDGKTIASYTGQALQTFVIPVEDLSSSAPPLRAAENAPVLGQGHAAMVFLNLQLPADSKVPAELSHRLSLSVTRQNGELLKTTVSCAVVKVVEVPPPVLLPPVRGSGWVAFNALGSADHRRALNAVDGRERIPQRFAIDWVRLDQHGKLLQGDKNSNSSYFDYGSEVQAVADGQISDLKDSEPEYNGATERAARAVTIDNVLGNYIILDLGGSRFAVYAHLQPGSLKVKIGEHVKPGQVLARLGNSGNSDSPHLHFQLVDANFGLAAEGIPCEFQSFTQVGTVENEDALLQSGATWSGRGQPVIHRHEFPLDGSVVDFP